MKTLDPLVAAKMLMKQVVGDGAFLTTKSGDRLNTMTIGWTMVGVIWGRPAMMVAVRPSRFTFDIIEHAPDFTVSAPIKGMKEELLCCGTHSGRDCDKFSGCSICIADGKKTLSPIIKMNGIHFESQIIQITSMNNKRVAKQIQQYYTSDDFHNLYFGEIVACYQT